MNLHSTGYYSVIQFCPDRSRMEVANIGVLLFVESVRFLKVRFSANNEIIRRFFGKEYRLDLSGLDAMKRMLEHRLDLESDGFNCASTLDVFLQRFANEIVFTTLRPVRIDNPAMELAQLFYELVEPRARPESPAMEADSLASVRRRFAQPDIAAKLQRGLRIHVPVVNEKLHVDYGFQNGRFNLIQLKEFRKKKSSAILREAKGIAVDGHLIFNHPDLRRRQQQLVLVAGFVGRNLELSENISNLMAEHNVRYFTEFDIDALTDMILKSAH